MNKEAMYKLSYGLFVLTAKEGKKDNGCIINTAIQAASAPNQLSICINKANATHDMIVNTGKFTVSVLSQAADFELFKRFGFQSGRDVDKFEGYEACRRSENPEIHYNYKMTLQCIYFGKGRSYGRPRLPYDVHRRDHGYGCFEQGSICNL